MFEVGVYSIIVVDDIGCIVEVFYELVFILVVNVGLDKIIYCVGVVEIGVLFVDFGWIWMDGSVVLAWFELEDGILMEFGFINVYVGMNILVLNLLDNLDVVMFVVEFG